MPKAVARRRTVQKGCGVALMKSTLRQGALPDQCVHCGCRDEVLLLRSACAQCAAEIRICAICLRDGHRACAKHNCAAAS